MASLSDGRSPERVMGGDGKAKNKVRTRKLFGRLLTLDHTPRLIFRVRQTPEQQCVYLQSALGATSLCTDARVRHHPRLPCAKQGRLQKTPSLAAHRFNHSRAYIPDRRFLMQWPRKEGKKVVSAFGRLYFPYEPVNPPDEGEGGVEMDVQDDETEADAEMDNADDGYNADSEGKEGG